jgi:hypothetical protein
MATEPEDRKDLKIARVVLSKGREVVGLGYSRVTGVATKGTDKRENSGNHSRVDRVSKTEQHYPSRVSRFGRVTQVSQTTSQTGKQIELAGLAGLLRLAQIAARIDGQIRLVGLATWCRKRRF